MEKIKNILKSLWDLQQKTFYYLANRLGYFALLIRPIILAFISVKVWQFLRYHFPDLIISYEDKDIYQVGFAFIGSLHMIIAGLQLTKIAGQKNMLKTAKRKKDGEIFLENGCATMDQDIKALLGVFSIVVLLLFALYPFMSEWAGKVFVSAVMFSLYLVWETAVELDDPFHGARRIKLVDVLRDYGNETYESVIEYLGEKKVKELRALDKYKS